MKRNTEYTLQPQCSCGYVFRDAWEMDFGDGDDSYDTECRRCNASISIVRNVSITYSATITP